MAIGVSVQAWTRLTLIAFFSADALLCMTGEQLCMELCVMMYSDPGRGMSFFVKPIAWM